jgi:hypothetical protein
VLSEGRKSGTFWPSPRRSTLWISEGRVIMDLDDKARGTFKIINRTFDQVESNLKSARERGEMDENEYTMTRAAALKERVETLCYEVPGFREELDRLLRGV